MTPVGRVLMWSVVGNLIAAVFGAGLLYAQLINPSFWPALALIILIDLCCAWWFGRAIAALERHGQEKR